MLFAWEELKCDVLNLLGFNTTENLDSMYHYWKDGSRHDGVNSFVWYESRMRRQMGHDFAKEHILMRDVQARVKEIGFDATCNSSSIS